MSATSSRWTGAGRRPMIAAALVIVLLAALLVGIRLARSGGTYSVSADFAEAPGIYPGNAVTILGVQVGRVTSVEPSVSGVDVRMSLDSAHPLPADVHAFLMSPNAVNDRFIELDPGYAGHGPAFPRGGHIPRDRTVLPASVDQIIGNLDRFATELGPNGANADGSLSGLLHTFARMFGGTGQTIRAMLGNLGTTTSALAQNTDQVTSGLDNLGQLTHSLAGVSGTYSTLSRELAQVSSTLAGQGPAIGDVITNLADVLTELNTFVQRNRGNLADSITAMSRIAHQVSGQQQALARLMRDAPLATSDAGNTVHDGPDGPAVVTRLNPVRHPKGTRAICGDGVLRMLVLALEKDPSKRSTTDLACGLNWWLDSLPKGHGAADAGRFTLAALAGLGG